MSHSGWSTSHPAICEGTSLKLIRSVTVGTLALSLLFISWSNIFAAEGQGGVDWTGGFVTAVGYGTAPQGMPLSKAVLSARRAAEIDAQRALLEAVKGVHLDMQTTVGGSMQRDVVTRTRLEGVIRGAMLTKQDVAMLNGAPVATVTMTLCLDGRSSACAGKPALVSAISLDRFANQEYASSAESSLTTPPTPREPAIYDRTRPVTGAILLLGGQRFERVLLPVVVYRQKGENIMVYGVKRVSPEVVRTLGIVRYAASLEQARGMETVGANPVMIAAEAVSADNRLIITPQDAATLEETLRYGNNFLEKGRVVIVQ